MPLFTTLSFDLTVTSFFCTLTRGAALYVFGEQDYVTQLIGDSFKGLSGIDTIKLTPSHIRILPYLDVHTTHINTCIVGGEALLESDVKILRALNPGMKIYNEYGPTECTVGCIVWKVPETFHTILVGKPISNTSAFIFNADMELCPPGIEGEIYISGKTVGAGYFRDKEKTAARFIPVTDTSSKLYRTGDKGYWMPDGNIRYTGRNDQMIKIRGYRIEPGEIAVVIRQVPGVNDAFVTAYRNADNELELVGYYEGSQMLTDKIKSQLSVHLPAYMHPPHLIALEKFPLNVNGKLDNTALPSPGEVSAGMHRYVAPQTKLEKLLAGVWETVIKRTQIGIHDHFLSIGGDSIKAIQIVARMRDLGWKLQVGDILRHSTIASLVNYLQENDSQPEADAAITGEVPLTPLQIKFFNDNIVQPHYYNQSILLEAGGRVDEERLEKAILKLWRSHPMLRATFPISDNVRSQKILPADIPGNNLFLVESDTEQRTEEQIRYWQARFDVEKGPLFRCLLFRDDEKDVIFLLAHHLIIDGVSWRILLEQLSRLYLASNLEDVQLSTTGSYFQWSVALRQQVQQISNVEQDYWEKISESIIDEWPAGRHIEKTHRHYVLRSGILSAEKTRQLLHLDLHRMGISIEEILLSCLSETICRWNGMEEISCYLESHGRSSTGDASAFAETVGWFTMKYPIRLHGMPDADVAVNIYQTIQAIEQVPGNGEGYLCLKYLKDEHGLKNGNEPFFTFNYLGQADTLDNTPFSIHKVSSAREDVGAEIYMPSAVFFTLIITDGVLCIDISYHQDVYTRLAIEELLQLYIFTLERYIYELRHDNFSFKRTLSGIDTQGLNAKELDEILNSI
jgi:non-ribosomal peptide synthase protein (TIGR01720 family)